MQTATLHGNRLLAVRVAWIVLTILVVGFSVAFLLDAYANYPTACAECRPFWQIGPKDVPALRALGLPLDFYAAYGLAIEIIHSLSFWVIGAVIFWRKSGDRLALFFSLMLVVVGALNAIDLAVGLHPTLDLLGEMFSFLAYLAFFTSFFIFPDGRFVPSWTRWMAILWALYLAALFFLPEGLPLYPATWAFLPRMALVIGLFGSMLFAQVYRYRRVSGISERQQTKWVVFGLTAAIIGSFVGSLPAAAFGNVRQSDAEEILYAIFELTVNNFSLLLIPLSIGVAVLRYRLWDIDIIINRTLVYGALTASVVVIYAILVGSLGSLLQSRGNFLVSLVAAALVAVLFAPLRNRLQRAVNRLMYGERDNPYGVLSNLGRRLEATLEPWAVLPTIVETVAGALKLPYVAIAMRREDRFEVAAAYGSPAGEETKLPLNYAGDTVGKLILSPRTPGETFSSADRRLLEDLARQAEVAVHAVRLNADLQKSRERLVSAREEERRRLRRDLHDGLGPTLATLSLGLDVSLKVLKTDPEEAEAMLRELKSQTQSAVVDIRRLVYGLRPPALDDLGLVPAIREHASRQGTLSDSAFGEPGRAAVKGGLIFSVEAPENLPPLPAAVEVACYRIAQEAVTNVVRHAEARTCRISLSIEYTRDELKLEVADDGVGLPEGRRAGVGMSSMTERAAELGGMCKVVRASGGGTCVFVRLPLFVEKE